MRPVVVKHADDLSKGYIRVLLNDGDAPAASANRLNQLWRSSVAASQVLARISSKTKKTMPSGSFILQTRPNEIQKSQRRAVPLQHCSSVKDCVAKHLMETHTEIEATVRQDVGIGSRVCGSCDPAMRLVLNRGYTNMWQRFAAIQFRGANINCST